MKGTRSYRASCAWAHTMAINESENSGLLRQHKTTIIVVAAMHSMAKVK